MLETLQRSNIAIENMPFILDLPTLESSDSAQVKLPEDTQTNSGVAKLAARGCDICYLVACITTG